MHPRACVHRSKLCISRVWLTSFFSMRARSKSPVAEFCIIHVARKRDCSARAGQYVRDVNGRSREIMFSAVGSAVVPLFLFIYNCTGARARDNYHDPAVWGETTTGLRMSRTCLLFFISLVFYRKYGSCSRCYWTQSKLFYALDWWHFGFHNIGRWCGKAFVLSWLPVQILRKAIKGKNSENMELRLVKIIIQLYYHKHKLWYSLIGRWNLHFDSLILVVKWIHTSKEWLYATNSISISLAK